MALRHAISYFRAHLTACLRTTWDEQVRVSSCMARLVECDAGRKQLDSPDLLAPSGDILRLFVQTALYSAGEESCC